MALAAACSVDVDDADDSFDAGLVAALEDVVAETVRDATGGAVVAVDTPDARVTVAAGSANLDGQALRGDEAFRLASVTKPFVAAVALQLAEDDALDLDAPVAQMRSERTEAFAHGDELTMRHLLGHTAGLADFLGPRYVLDVLAEVDVDLGARVVVGDCADAAARDRLAYAADQEATFAPGDGRAYSNSNYVLAGEVIEAATGQPLGDVVAERILDPLALDTAWLDCGDQPRGELARGLHPPGAFGIAVPGQGDEPLDVTDAERDLGAVGGLAATAEDVAAFARALVDGDLFEDEATRSLMLDADGGDGLGLMAFDEAVGHDGGMPGYGARLRYHPDRDVVIVVLSNETPDVAPIVDRVHAGVVGVLDAHGR